MSASIQELEQTLARELGRVVIGAAGRGARTRDRAHRARPRAGAGRAGPRQDAAGQGAGARTGRRIPAHPGHGRPDAERHHRRARLRRVAAQLRVPSRTAVRRRGAGGRDQPRRPQDSVGAARGDGGAPGERRAHHVAAARGFPGDRHAEPARVRGHVPAARVAARSFHAAHRHGLPGARGGGRDPRPLRRGAERGAGGTRHGDAACPRAAVAGPRRGRSDPRRAGAQCLRARPGARLALARAPHPRPVHARRAGAAEGGAHRRRAARRRVRHARRREGGRSERHGATGCC